MHTAFAITAAYSLAMTLVKLVYVLSLRESEPLMLLSMIINCILFVRTQIQRALYTASARSLEVSKEVYSSKVVDQGFDRYMDCR